jgi:iron complex outermembrane receptor protein
MKALPLTMGGSWNWTPSVLVQTSATESTYTGLKRQIDLYGLWKFNPGTQLRVSVNNLNPNLYNTGRSVSGDALSQAAGAPAAGVPVTESSNTATRTYATVSVRLEMKL